MSKLTSKNYFSSITLFVVIGFVLLTGIIVFHDSINKSPHLSGRMVADRYSGTAVPQAVINEVVNSSKNISPLSKDYSKDASPFFLTQQ